MAGEKVVAFSIKILGTDRELKTMDELKQAIKETSAVANSQEFGSGAHQRATNQLQNLLAEQQKLRKENEVTQKLFNSLEFPVGSYRQLQAEVAGLTEKLRQSAVGVNITEDAYKKLFAQVSEGKKKLADFDRALSPSGTLVGEYARGIKQAFDDSEIGGFFAKITQASEASSGAVQGSIAQMRAELQLLKELQQNYTEEGSKEFEELGQKIQEVGSKVKDYDSDLKAAIKSGAGTDNILKSLASVSAAFVGAAGAAGSFFGEITGNKEKADAATQKLVQTIQTVQALSAIASAAEEAQFLKNIALQKIAVAQKVLEGAVESRNVVIKYAATAAQWALNAAMNANPFGIVLLAIVAVGAALYAFTKQSDEAADAIAKINDGLDETVKQLEYEKRIYEAMGKSSVDAQRKILEAEKKAADDSFEILFAKLTKQGTLYGEDSKLYKELLAKKQEADGKYYVFEEQQRTNKRQAENQAKLDALKNLNETHAAELKLLNESREQQRAALQVQVQDYKDAALAKQILDNFDTQTEKQRADLSKKYFDLRVGYLRELADLQNQLLQQSQVLFTPPAQIVNEQKIALDNLSKLQADARKKNADALKKGLIDEAQFKTIQKDQDAQFAQARKAIEEKAASDQVALALRSAKELNDLRVQNREQELQDIDLRYQELQTKFKDNAEALAQLAVNKQAEVNAVQFKYDTAELDKNYHEQLTLLETNLNYALAALTGAESKELSLVTGKEKEQAAVRKKYTSERLELETKTEEQSYAIKKAALQKQLDLVNAELAAAKQTLFLLTENAGASTEGAEASPDSPELLQARKEFDERKRMADELGLKLSELEESHTKTVAEQSAARAQILEEEQAQIKAAAEAQRKKRLEDAGQYLSLASQVLDQVGGLIEAFEARATKAVDEKNSSIQENIDRLEERISNSSGRQKAIYEGQLKREKEAYQKNEEEKLALQKKFAKQKKAMDLIQAIISTALAVVNALASTPFIPVGVAAAVAAGVAGGIQIATIASQPLAQGGNLDNVSGGTIPAGAGVISGPSHAQGGIKFKYKGRPFEAEGGEIKTNNGAQRYIFTKRVAQDPVLKQIALATHNNTGHPLAGIIGSMVNSYAGGRPFGEYGTGFMAGGGSLDSVMGPVLSAPVIVTNVTDPTIVNLLNEVNAANGRLDAKTDAINQRIDTLKVAVPVDQVTDIQGNTSEVRSTLQVG